MGFPTCPIDGLTYSDFIRDLKQSNFNTGLVIVKSTPPIPMTGPNYPNLLPFASDLPMLTCRFMQEANILFLSHSDIYLCQHNTLPLGKNHNPHTIHHYFLQWVSPHHFPTTLDLMTSHIVWDRPSPLAHPISLTTLWHSTSIPCDWSKMDH